MGEASDWSSVRAMLDGAWLRTERERIAVGRRPVAERLGIAESSLARVERQALDVPLSWLPGLAALGFPVQHPQADTAVVTAPSSEPDVNTPLDDANRLRGQWLRAQRFEQAVHLHRLAKALHVRCAGLLQPERSNLLLPVAWMAPLMELGLVPCERGGSACRGAGSGVDPRALASARATSSRAFAGGSGCGAAGSAVAARRRRVLRCTRANGWGPALRRFGFPDAHAPVAEEALDTAPAWSLRPRDWRGRSR